MPDKFGWDRPFGNNPAPTRHQLRQAALIKKVMQDALMHGMKTAIANLPEDAVDERRIAERQFRRVERLFGYEPNSWPVGV